MNNKILKNIFLILLFVSITMFYLSTLSLAQDKVQGSDTRYLRIGELQTHFTAYGSERAWNNSYYEGLRWPALYSYTDNSVIERVWIATDDFTDPGNYNWEKYAVYFALSYEGESLFPVELKQTAKFQPPTVIVDGSNITAPYMGDVDEIDSEQIPDRIITNVVNTSMGLTVTRRILAFSQQYHDSYFIKEYTFTNTGNVDWDADIELTAPLKGVRFGYGIRYSCSREGSFNIGATQSWGQQSWVTKRGEDYPDHVGEKITEDNPIVQWLRCGFEWSGQVSTNSFDNIGGPEVKGDGRLTAPQHAGIVVLHVDKNAADKTDDPNQPVALGWHAGDTYPSIPDMSPGSEKSMIQVYNMISGNPVGSLGGNDRMDETYMDQSYLDGTFTNISPDPFSVHNDGGGTNLWACYGPFDLEHGESITIVEAEAVNGLSRQMCEEIGARWKKAYDNAADEGPFTLPDGSTTKDKNQYKNTWFYTGKDSILLTFGRAKRNFDANYEIPQPPLPPPLFEVNSGGDQISLKWSPSPSEGESDFAGYKLYRAVGKPDTTYIPLATCEPGITEYNDQSAIRGYSYYYYIVAYNDGSNNTSGETNPTGQLHSNMFYTRTTEPAYLSRKAGNNLGEIRVVPNPYNIRAKDLQYPQEENKIMFLDIPGYCKIRIFTERGDLIETIDHNNGSGDESWFLLTSSRQVVVSGVYIAHFEVTQSYYDPETNDLLYKKGETAIRKFVVIR